MDIEERVLLLAIFKKADDESLDDILLKVSETGTFNLKHGKKYLKNLKNKGYIIGKKLSFIGVEEAKKVELEFKKHF